jgi:hypothetical protein
MKCCRSRVAALLAIITCLPAEMPALAAPGGFPTLAQGPESICIPGLDASPGTMTPLGFPCPSGTVPSSSATLTGPPSRTAETADMDGPNWSRSPEGAAGVSGASRMTGGVAESTGPGTEMPAFVTELPSPEDMENASR